MRCNALQQTRCKSHSTAASSRSRSRLVVAATTERPAAAPNAAAPAAIDDATRRGILAAVLGMAVTGASGAAMTPPAEALGAGDPLNYKKELARRRRKIPEEDYTDGPLGLKYFDIEEGGGAEAKVGARVAVHYDIKWRGITFMTSRQGMGVTGGTPIGFDVGTTAGDAGSTLPGLDYGVRGMRVGGLRSVLVPPELGYGGTQMGEIPPNSTLSLTIELLSIKTNPLGYRTKLVEG